MAEGLRDFLFVDCCLNVFIQDRFQDTTTCEVNVTACDLENSFIFHNKVSITSHMCFLIYMSKVINFISLYLHLSPP